MICFANHFQFAPAQVIGPRTVQSRMILWVLKGEGSIEVNGDLYALSPGSWLLVPWLHRILYQADKQEPFLIGCIHAIPFFSKPDQTPLRVYHSDFNGPTPWPGRQDKTLPGIPAGSCGGYLEANSRLELLANYIVRLWRETQPTPALAESLWDCLVCEIQSELSSLRSAALPVELCAAMEFAREHLREPIRNGDLAQIAGLSEASLVRRFRKHLHCSPSAWLNEQRIEKACRLLSQGSEPMAQIAIRCGFCDPYHFSKTFKKAMACTPSEYRKKHWV